VKIKTSAALPSDAAPVGLRLPREFDGAELAPLAFDVTAPRFPASAVCRFIMNGFYSMRFGPPTRLSRRD
jgi:hypothetical protein